MGIEGRKIAILASNNFDGAVVNALRKALIAQGAMAKLLAATSEDITSNEGENMQVDHSLPTVSSILFDAVFIPGDEENAQYLCSDANAILFIKEAYKQGKAIAANDGGVLLLNKALQLPDSENVEFEADDEFKAGDFKTDGITVELGERVDKAFIDRFIADIAKHRFPARADVDMIVA